MTAGARDLAVESWLPVWWRAYSVLPDQLSVLAPQFVVTPYWLAENSAEPQQGFEKRV